MKELNYRIVRRADKFEIYYFEETHKGYITTAVRQILRLFRLSISSLKSTVLVNDVSWMIDIFDTSRYSDTSFLEQQLDGRDSDLFLIHFFQSETSQSAFLIQKIVTNYPHLQVILFRSLIDGTIDKSYAEKIMNNWIDANFFCWKSNPSLQLLWCLEFIRKKELKTPPQLETCQENWIEKDPLVCVYLGQKMTVDTSMKYMLGLFPDIEEESKSESHSKFQFGD